MYKNIKYIENNYKRNNNTQVFVCVELKYVKKFL